MGPPANDGASRNYRGLVHGLRVPLPPLGLGSTAGTCVCVIARLPAVDAELHLPIPVCCMCGPGACKQCCKVYNVLLSSELGATRLQGG